MTDITDMIFGSFQDAMARAEIYPLILAGEFKLGGRTGTPAEGGFTFRYVVHSFSELKWVLENCFPMNDKSRLPTDVFCNLGQYPQLRGGGCLDDESRFRWTLERL